MSISNCHTHMCKLAILLDAVYGLFAGIHVCIFPLFTADLR